MRERKVIRVKVPVPGAHHPPMTQYIDKAFDVGEPAPEGHEKRPYTQEVKGKPPVAEDDESGAVKHDKHQGKKAEK
jgi:hypothetical protein